MDLPPAAVKALMFLVIGSVIGVMFEIRRRIGASVVASAAEENNLAFEPHGDFDEFLVGLELIADASSDRSYTNCLTGEAKGHVFRAFDLNTQFGNSAPWVATAVAIESHNQLPSFVIVTKDPLQGFLSSFFARKKNEVELAGKTRRVKVLADDKHPAIQKLFSDEVIEVLLKHEWKIESTPQQFVAYMSDRRWVPAKEVLEFSKDALKIFHSCKALHSVGQAEFETAKLEPVPA